jgi:signal peptidase II
MTMGESRTIIDGIFSLTYIHNRGAVFGIMQGQSVFFMVMAIVIVLVIVAYNFRYAPQPVVQYLLGLVAGGSLGNIVDRWFYGSVIDFFSVGWWPVFNIADSAIVCGGILLVIYFWRNEPSQHHDV